jgi:transposase, IS5 family
MVGARSFPGNPYDGHTLAEQLEQTNTLLQDIGIKPTTAVVDLGFRGVDQACAPVQIIHRGKFKSLDTQQRRWLKRRQAIEPAIGHAKSDHRMDRCWLQGASGDALHAVLCAAGFNIRWLLRAIAAKGLKGLLLALSQWMLWLRWITSALPIASTARAPPTSSLASRPHHARAVLCGTQR